MADFIDLVDKKKLIRNILRILDKHINASAEYPSELFEIKRELLKIIEIEQSFFTQDSVNRWISVDDALPEIGFSVLVTRQTENNTRYVRIASRQDGCWMDNTDKYGKPNPHQVIAWMPIPDAYKSPEEGVTDG